MSTLKSRTNGLRIVQRRNQRLASSHNRTNQLLKRAASLGLVETYEDDHGRLRTKKEKMLTKQ
ncbi:hypothetical protein [Mesobacillus jeotgali]|uniref:hypothetical protein n=1 Tax=Mesobacillus jeotgali TaxID=129985 RepID=UPI0009A68404|nr:hypothetical protein [Mesobacillus jeotgali]